MTSTSSAHAAASRDDVATLLTSAYFEVVAGNPSHAEAHELSIEFGLHATVDRLIAVGRAVRDAFPWVPFLRALRSTPSSRRAERAMDAELRLYNVARLMLDRQGLSLVRPEDCLRRPSTFEQACASLMNTNI